VYSLPDIWTMNSRKMRWLMHVSAWNRRHLQVFCGNTKEIDGLEDLSIYAGDNLWSGCIWLWRGTSGGLSGRW
jgi:hypothetical protein